MGDKILPFVRTLKRDYITYFEWNFSQIPTKYPEITTLVTITKEIYKFMEKIVDFGKSTSQILANFSEKAKKSFAVFKTRR